MALYWEERVVDWVKQSAGALAAGAMAMALTGATTALADSPFPSLVGAWSGKGTARIEGGKNEKLSCKGYYSGTGNNQMRLNIICANPSTKVELRSQLTYANGRVTGTWEERNFNQTGTISGSADESKLRLNIGGGALNGQLSVSFTGAKQSVSLSTQGSALKGVNISFARNG
ncbi:hypothetical protein [Hyphomicrobium sulfonivorans]|uniref:hypothetical protein n=1 Tax=Hyphomicrobium sulfonivorans TaxID=121290 RepID=UPI001FE856F9|nr:hypothetical protein [Hyphomicrobium sulfonivorans]